ncbi:MAG: hypothetical protein V3V09_01900 [Arenicellales bacterium]
MHAKRNTNWNDWRMNVVWVCDEHIKKIPDASENYCHGRDYQQSFGALIHSAEHFSLEN